MSPNYPNNYDADLDCLWHIKKPLSQRDKLIKLYCPSVKLEGGPYCDMDYLIVSEGMDLDSQYICNFEVPASISFGVFGHTFLLL